MTAADGLNAGVNEFEDEVVAASAGVTLKSWNAGLPPALMVAGDVALIVKTSAEPAPVACVAAAAVGHVTTCPATPHPAAVIPVKPAGSVVTICTFVAVLGPLLVTVRVQDVAADSATGLPVPFAGTNAAVRLI